MPNFNYLLLGCGSTSSEVNGEGGGTSWWMIIIYVVIFAAFIYFIMIRPQRKQKQKQADTMNQMEPGDSVLTTSGFYGTVVSVTPDTVIVEFGNNKNCRIPMSKQAISQVEKANGGSSASQQPQSRKKFFDRAAKNEEVTNAPAEAPVEAPAEIPAEIPAEQPTEPTEGKNE